ncbi:UNVERIFIED_CONTAM: hypothetical protein O8I53_11400 [Campylobacter lari]
MKSTKKILISNIIASLVIFIASVVVVSIKQAASTLGTYILGLLTVYSAVVITQYFTDIHPYRKDNSKISLVWLILVSIFSLTIILSILYVILTTANVFANSIYSIVTYIINIILTAPFMCFMIYLGIRYIVRRKKSRK